MDKSKKIGFIAGPLLFLLLLVTNPFGLTDNAAAVCAVVIWLMIWWVTEAVPIAVTSLLPLILFPWLGVMDMEATSKTYSNRFVFLFLGGFILALAMEKWNLHRRIALTIVNLTGTSANKIILGFFLATYFISMWISNTATAMMMLPIATSVVVLLLSKHEGSIHERDKRNFSIAIMLSVAYGASIGGMATLVGTPPNAAMAGILSGESFNTNVTFFDWFKIGFPFSIVLLLVSYFLMTRFIYPNKLGKFEMGHDIISNELSLLGKWKTSEKRIFIVFVTTALLWICMEPLSVALNRYGIEFSDAAVALTAGIVLFIIPIGKLNSGPILQWKDTEKLPWGVLLMFGGGMAIAESFKVSGLVDQITGAMENLDRSNLFVYVVALCGIGLILTALMSNLAMVNIFVPIVGALAVTAGQSPELFAIPVTLAASCDFMFPMSTPPNAIAYSSGYVNAKQMFRAGIVLNLVSFVLLAGIVYLMLQ